MCYKSANGWSYHDPANQIACFLSLSHTKPYTHTKSLSQAKSLSRSIPPNVRVLNWPIVHHPMKQIAITQRRATKASPGGLKGFPRGTFVGGCVRSTLYIYPSLCAIILLRNVVNAFRGDKYITQIRAIKAPKASRKGFSRVCCELYLSFPSYLCATETKAHDDDEIMSIAIGLPASSYLTDWFMSGGAARHLADG